MVDSGRRNIDGPDNRAEDRSLVFVVSFPADRSLGLGIQRAERGQQQAQQREPRSGVGHLLLAAGLAGRVGRLTLDGLCFLKMEARRSQWKFPQYFLKVCLRIKMK